MGRWTKRQLHCADGVQARGGPDDGQREHQPHPEHRNKNPDGQEHPLPKRAHPLQNRGVDDGVVERQRYLKERQNRQQEQGGRPAVQISGNQRHHRHQQREAEDAER